MTERYDLLANMSNPRAETRGRLTVRSSIRDEIGERVRTLIAELGLAAAR